MDEARQCEECGVLRLDSYCYFARYICGRCRQRAADEEQRAQEQSRLGIQVLSLACFEPFGRYLPGVLIRLRGR